MDRNNKNRSGKASRNVPKIVSPPIEPESQPAATPVSEIDAEMLFEATEAFIRALSIQDPAIGEQAAVANAINAEALAPFDGPVVMEAVGFLRRMGYLSREPHKAA